MTIHNYLISGIAMILLCFIGLPTSGYSNCVSPEEHPKFADVTHTKAIQWAIDQAAAASEATFLCLKPNEIYIVDSQIDGKGVSIMGNDATLRVADHPLQPFSFRVLFYENVENFSIHDLVIDGNKHNFLPEELAYTPIMHLLKSSNIEIVNLTLTDV